MQIDFSFVVPYSFQWNIVTYHLQCLSCAAAFSCAPAVAYVNRCPHFYLRIFLFSYSSVILFLYGIAGVCTVTLVG